MSFYTLLQQYPASDLKKRLYEISPEDIDRALSQQKLSVADFICLLSPKINNDQLETLAGIAHRITSQRFGRTIQLYAPLYLSNECHNGCKYCGFSADNHDLRRKTLNDDEILREGDHLHRQGFRHILLLTGEAPEAAGVDYLEHAVKLLSAKFSSLSIEVFPMSRDDYQRLEHVGIDGLALYQETYDQRLYPELHPFGPKSDFRYRLEAPERAGEAGLRRIGIGALLGLGDYLTDAFYTGLHARYLMHRFWRTQVSISFPRLRPAEGGFAPRSIVTDRQLTQLICALRLFLPDAGLILSTRESAELRDNLLPLGITQMSAGSCTAPGGYEGDEGDGEQFAISDHRSPEEIRVLLAERGYEAVWKDWDGAFLGQPE
ncbi:2-iminoacetate synthase ThiH [Geopsychrobacter electrodiphilus]|uniref:2-iminoacetate synthase ThiH n=1 Tax=Geopsychrobacter electrodiphilus TaxID=225196 RepID=UPI0003711098|nr:2-iminoacetate synthase ThiH [Geopsychrobacter electrodiphilus]